MSNQVSIIKPTKYCYEKNRTLFITAIPNPFSLIRIPKCSLAEQTKEQSEIWHLSWKATEYMQIIYDDDTVHITQLYKIIFKNRNIHMTREIVGWKDATFLAVELDHEWITIYADFNPHLIPITIYFRSKRIELHHCYEKFNWIEKATREDFQRICDIIAINFEDSQKESMQMIAHMY